MSKVSPPDPLTTTLVTASKPVPKLLSPDVAAEAVDALPDDAPVLPPPTTASATAPPASPAAMIGPPDAAAASAGANRSKPRVAIASLPAAMLLSGPPSASDPLSFTASPTTPLDRGGGSGLAVAAGAPPSALAARPGSPTTSAAPASPLDTSTTVASTGGTSPVPTGSRLAAPFTWRMESATPMVPPTVIFVKPFAQRS